MEVSILPLWLVTGMMSELMERTTDAHNHVSEKSSREGKGMYVKIPRLALKWFIL